MTNTAQIARLRHVTRYFYDLQKLRIQSGNRDKSVTVELDDKDKEFLGQTSDMLEGIEKFALKEISRLLRPISIYDSWLSEQRGIGPTMAGVLLSYINIENCHTVSKLWAWCGLAVVDGQADRRRKGEKARYDPWLKSKVLAVMGGNLIKAASLDDRGYYLTSSMPNPLYVAGTKKPKKGEADDEEIDTKFFIRLYDPSDVPTPEELLALKAPAWKKTIQIRKPLATQPWRKFYDDYKHRKENQLCEVCMGCEGTGTYKISAKERERYDLLVKLGDRVEPEEIKEREELEAVLKGTTCGNCGGTGGPAPWGRSKQHRHNASMRYMVKMFLAQFWEAWRRSEGLEVRPSYAEEYLNRGHHGESSYA